jgi:molecular chaperone GrpE
MSEEDINADTDRLLAGFDFSQAMAVAEAARKREFDRLLLGFMEVVDSLIQLERAADEATTGLARSLRAVLRNAMRVLLAEGIEPLSCLGVAVDLDTCEVVEVRADSAYPEDTVIDEVQRGYMRQGRLVRRAKVVIAGPLPQPQA